MKIVTGFMLGLLIGYMGTVVAAEKYKCSNPIWTGGYWVLTEFNDKQVELGLCHDGIIIWRNPIVN